MADYRRVYDSHHLQADCQVPGSAPEPYTLGSRVRAAFALFTYKVCKAPLAIQKKSAKTPTSAVARCDVILKPTDTAGVNGRN